MPRPVMQLEGSHSYIRTLPATSANNQTCHRRSVQFKLAKEERRAANRLEASKPKRKYVRKAEKMAAAHIVQLSIPTSVARLYQKTPLTITLAYFAGLSAEIIRTRPHLLDLFRERLAASAYAENSMDEIVAILFERFPGLAVTDLPLLEQHRSSEQTLVRDSEGNVPYAMLGVAFTVCTEWLCAYPCKEAVKHAAEHVYLIARNYVAQTVKATYYRRGSQVNSEKFFIENIEHSLGITAMGKGVVLQYYTAAPMNNQRVVGVQTVHNVATLPATEKVVWIRAVILSPGSVVQEAGYTSNSYGNFFTLPYCSVDSYYRAAAPPATKQAPRNTASLSCTSLAGTPCEDITNHKTCCTVPLAAFDILPTPTTKCAPSHFVRTSGAPSDANIYCREPHIHGPEAKIEGIPDTAVPPPLSGYLDGLTVDFYHTHPVCIDSATAQRKGTVEVSDDLLVELVQFGEGL